MYALKSIARRGTSLGAAFALAIGAILPAVLPATSAYADALNPLTKRSLTLSSSSPGWSYTDGSGNPTYAPPNSGANGQKTGNTFSFHVSTDTSGAGDKIKTMSFQYCTTSAGDCTSPGNDATHGTDTATTSDLNVATATPREVGNTTGGVSGAFSDFVNASGDVTAMPNRDDSEGNYVVYWDNGGTWQQSTGWTMSATNVEDGTGTGQNNYIILTNSAGLGLPADAAVKVVFFGTDGNYITNPGDGAFFVKINTYKVAYDGTAVTTSDLEPTTDTNVIDGGVTVANVMNQSIQITTKVLETMEFSVGTVDPDTLTSDNTTSSAYYAATGKKLHGPCDRIATAETTSDANKNVLRLGDQAAESSLSTDHTYATHSYWRLSSNSSAGATVYYSGHTLTNTEGDDVDAIGVTKQESHQGSEQFGLAIDAVPLTGGHTFDDASYGVDYTQDRQGGTLDYENGDDNGLTAVNDTTLTDLGAVNTPPWDYTNLNGSFHMPRLDPLTPTTNYGSGAGQVNSDGVDPLSGTQAQFAFDPNSDTLPVALASENSQVVDCVTAKMRYIANIAAITPAGIYTTKVNYIAAPQY